MKKHDSAIVLTPGASRKPIPDVLNPHPAFTPEADAPQPTSQLSASLLLRWPTTKGPKNNLFSVSLPLGSVKTSFINPSTKTITFQAKRPKTLKLSQCLSPRLDLACGLYIVSAQTSAGKSVVTNCIAQIAMAAGLAVNDIYVYEARTEAPFMSSVDAATYAALDAVYKLGELYKLEVLAESGTVDIPMFQNPRTLYHDLILLTAGMKPFEETAVLVVDSIGLATLSVDPFNMRATDAAMKGGVMKSDFAAALAISELMRKLNICLLGIMNKTQIPFTEGLEGSVEGMINVSDATQFTIRDRVRREVTSYSLDSDFVTAVARDVFGYTGNSKTSILKSLNDEVLDLSRGKI